MGPTVVKKRDDPEVSRDNIRDTSIVLKMGMMVSGPVPGRKAAKERKPIDTILVVYQIVKRRVVAIGRKWDASKPRTDAL
jgi:hypothetical protein